MYRLIIQVPGTVRKELAVAAILATLALPATADAYQFRPPIGEGQAKQRAYKFLREIPGWRYKGGGWLECQGGRVNNYSWACRVAWWRGRRCRVGRIRVTNIQGEDGVTKYDIHIRARRC